MSNFYLAIDIGASSGRHILGYMDEGKLYIEEVHRFENSMIMTDGSLCWNLPELFKEIVKGMKKCKDIGKIPVSLGVDTWGVDFVLIDKENSMIGNAVAYRDKRTQGMDAKVFSIISEAELYQRTGIQKQIFNTIYQLMAVKEHNPEHLNKAESLLMIPDYFNFLLSGVKCCEYTNATTTQLINPLTMDWDSELIKLLGLPERIFTNIAPTGSCLGYLTKELQEEIGYNCKVMLPATHDTGSAVMAIPSSGPNPLYISSGTWSLMGTELSKANCSIDSMKLNFTNEGGYDRRYRYMKNIMGLWMIQCVKKEIGINCNFADICQLASQTAIFSIVDCNDERFLSPENMTKEIQDLCKETNQHIPANLQEVAAVVYNSLAKCYKDTVNELEEITRLSFDCIHVIGGGSNADYLNELTARLTGKILYAGPTEATAIGNILAQMIASRELDNLAKARECVMRSFIVKKYSAAKGGYYDNEGKI